MKDYKKENIDLEIKNSKSIALQKEAEEKNKNLIHPNTLKVCECVDCSEPVLVKTSTNPRYVRCANCKSQYQKFSKKENESQLIKKIKEKRLQDFGHFVCEYCGKEFTEDYRTDLSSVRKKAPRFCSKICARAYSSNKLKDNPKIKIFKCPECGVNFEADSRADPSRTCCPECKIKITRMRDTYSRYKKCGFEGTKEEFKKLFLSQESPYDLEELNNSLEENFGFKKTIKYKKKSGPRQHSSKDRSNSSFYCFCGHRGVTSKFQINEKDLPSWTFLNENRHYKDIYNKEYFLRVKEKEIYYFQFPPDTPIGKFERGMCFRKKYGILNNIHFDFYQPVDEEWNKHREILSKMAFEDFMVKDEIAKIFNLNSASAVNYLYELFNINILYNSNANSKFQHAMGFHTSWEGNEYIFRSSYELMLMKYLDSHKIHYRANGKKNLNRITYYDPASQKVRKGYPDFYLPDYNCYVETKGTHLFDKENLLARYEEIKKENNSLIVIGFNEKIHHFSCYMSLFENKEKEKEILNILDILTFINPDEIIDSSSREKIYNKTKKSSDDKE